MKNVPNLRFKEFSGEWEYKLLSSFATKITQKNGDYKVTNVISNSAKNGLVSQKDYFDKDIANQENINGYYVINNGDFVYNPRKSNESPYGPINRFSSTEAGVVSPLYLCFSVNCEVNDRYLEYYFKSSKWYQFIYKNSDQGARHDRVSIRDAEFFKMKLNIPNYQEQEKIASFFSLIDKKIELQTEKVEELKNYKKGIMQKIFSQELRFKDENGNDYPKWKVIKLSKVLTERKTYAEKDGKYPHVTLSKDGIYDKGERYDRDFLVKTEDKKYKITHRGDICYNPANLKFGVICRNDFGDAIFSPIYVTFEINKDVDSNYMGYYLTRWDFINKVRKYEEGTVYERMAVKPEDFLKFNINLPNIREQKKISNFLNKIDSKIEFEKKKLEFLTAYKKGLLQQMFI